MNHGKTKSLHTSSWVVPDFPKMEGPTKISTKSVDEVPLELPMVNEEIG